MNIIIIGAGFAGATAAILLRDQLNARVTLLERCGVPGGMLRTLYTKEGLSYEYGPRVVSVFRGTQEIFPLLRRFVNLEENSSIKERASGRSIPSSRFPSTAIASVNFPVANKSNAS